MSPARPIGASRLATYFHVHLVSDSTGETLNAMAKAVTARFDGVIPIEHIYALIRSERQTSAMQVPWRNRRPSFQVFFLKQRFIRKLNSNFLIFTNFS